MDTMNNVNDLLTKVNTYLDKAKKQGRRKAMFFLHIWLEWFHKPRFLYANLNP